MKKKKKTKKKTQKYKYESEKNHSHTHITQNIVTVNEIRFCTTKARAQLLKSNVRHSVFIYPISTIKSFEERNSEHFNFQTHLRE